MFLEFVIRFVLISYLFSNVRLVREFCREIFLLFSGNRTISKLVVRFVIDIFIFLYVKYLKQCLYVSNYFVDFRQLVLVVGGTRLFFGRSTRVVETRGFKVFLGCKILRRILVGRIWEESKGFIFKFFFQVFYNICCFWVKLRLFSEGKEFLDFLKYFFRKMFFVF